MDRTLNIFRGRDDPSGLVTYKLRQMHKYVRSADPHPVALAAQLAIPPQLLLSEPPFPIMSSNVHVKPITQYVACCVCEAAQFISLTLMTCERNYQRICHFPSRSQKCLTTCHLGRKYPLDIDSHRPVISYK